MTLYRTDANHLRIKRALLAAGRPVRDVAAYHGFGCDLVAQHVDGHAVFLEVKDGSKPPSARKLTDSELSLSMAFPGCFAVVLTEEEALRACGLHVGSAA